MNIFYININTMKIKYFLYIQGCRESMIQNVVKLFPQG